MASNRVGKAGPDKHDEIVITFRKEKDNTYTKLTKTLSRDWKTGGISQMKRLPAVEEGPYTLSTQEDYDEKVSPLGMLRRAASGECLLQGEGVFRSWACLSGRLVVGV